MGPDGLIDLIKTWRTAFPDGIMTIDDIIVEGDLVGIRNTWHGTQKADFYGIPASGKWVDVTRSASTASSTARSPKAGASWTWSA